MLASPKFLFVLLHDDNLVVIVASSEGGKARVVTYALHDEPSRLLIDHVGSDLPSQRIVELVRLNTPTSLAETLILRQEVFGYCVGDITNLPDCIEDGAVDFLARLVFVLAQKVGEVLLFDLLDLLWRYVSLQVAVSIRLDCREHFRLILSLDVARYAHVFDGCRDLVTVRRVEYFLDSII